MPNYSYNSLSVTGKKEDLEKFLTDGLYGYEPVYKQSKMEDEVLGKPKKSQLERTMNKAIPVPQAILDAGYSRAGYDWQCEHWGTKWDFCDMHDNGTEDELKTAEAGKVLTLCYNFATAWSTNEPWVSCVAKKFPTLIFDLSYEEEAGFFAGRVIYKGFKELVRRDYTDMVLYNVMEDNRSLEEVIEDRYYNYEDDETVEEFLEHILEDFEEALLLSAVKKEDIIRLATEVYNEMRSEDEEDEDEEDVA